MANNFFLSNKKILTFLLNNQKATKKEEKMKNKLTNIIFVFTALIIAQHLYAGFGNPWDPRHDDNQNVTSDENAAQVEQPEELE